jgi:hypothetical protein
VVQHISLPPARCYSHLYIAQVSTARPGQAAKAPKRAPANWKNKHVIIDAINDLIDELENITTSITVQVGRGRSAVQWCTSGGVRRHCLAKVMLALSCFSYPHGILLACQVYLLYAILPSVAAPCPL